jgi:hypothetical protein
MRAQAVPHEQLPATGSENVLGQVRFPFLLHVFHISSNLSFRSPL